MKKYRIEIIVIMGYLLSDNIVEIVKWLEYTPDWYVPPPEDPSFTFADSVYSLFHYAMSASLLMTIVLFVSSPMEIKNIALRFSLLIAALIDVFGEVVETFNLNLPNFSNWGYSTTCFFKYAFIVSSYVVAFKMEKTCMKLLNCISFRSQHL